MVMRPRRLLAAASAALAAGLAAGLTACGASPAKPSNMITVSSNQCGDGWSVPGPGWHTFEINNQSTGGGEIDLIKLYLPGGAPRTPRYKALRASLRPGCLIVPPGRAASQRPARASLAFFAIGRAT
jgi:hypothetical protein